MLESLSNERVLRRSGQRFPQCPLLNSASTRIPCQCPSTISPFSFHSCNSLCPTVCLCLAVPIPICWVLIRLLGPNLRRFSFSVLFYNMQEIYIKQPLCTYEDILRRVLFQPHRSIVMKLCTDDIIRQAFTELPTNGTCMLMSNTIISLIPNTMWLFCTRKPVLLKRC